MFSEELKYLRTLICGKIFIIFSHYAYGIIFACMNISPALKQTSSVILFLPNILCINDNVS